MERGSGGGQMIMFTKETGRMGRDTGKEENIRVMEADTKEGSRTMRKKARECMRSQTVKDTKETSRMTKVMGKELVFTLMALHTMVNGKITRGTEMESLSFQTGQSAGASGKTIRTSGG